MEGTEVVTHPGVMAVALLDTPGVSTGSVEVVRDLRTLNMFLLLMGVKCTDLKAGCSASASLGD